MKQNYLEVKIYHNDFSNMFEYVNQSDMAKLPSQIVEELEDVPDLKITIRKTTALFQQVKFRTLSSQDKEDIAKIFIPEFKSEFMLAYARHKEIENGEVETTNQVLTKEEKNQGEKSDQNENKPSAIEIVKPRLEESLNENNQDSSNNQRREAHLSNRPPAAGQRKNIENLNNSNQVQNNNNIVQNSSRRMNGSKNFCRSHNDPMDQYFNLDLDDFSSQHSAMSRDQEIESYTK